MDDPCSGHPRTIPGLLEEQARRSPDATAIVAPGRTSLAFRDLVTLIEDTRASLNALSVGRNDRVAIVLPNGPEMAAAFLGVSAAATCAPLNPSYKLAEFDFFLTDLAAKAVIVQAGVDSPARAAARAHGIPVIELAPLVEEEAGLFSLAGRRRGKPIESAFAEPDDVALVLHTSGTTARPKQVPLTHRNLCRSARNIAASLALTARDRCLNLMPLFHIHGLIAGALAPLASGGSTVAPPGFFAPKFFEWLEQLEPTWYTAVPAMHQAILARAPAGPIRRLRFLRSSSSPLPPSVMTQLEAVFHAPAIEAYGMTEASHQIASNPLPPAERRPGSVGRAAGPDVAVMGADGGLLGPGAVGELVLRGENVTRGYEANPAANEAAFTNGWFRTGDAGTIDADSYIYLTGRIKEQINRGGEKISPREVDEALLVHPAIAQAAAFSVPHPVLGEDVGAAVVLKPGTAVTKAEILDFAAERLADFKVPGHLVFVSELPKGPTGKVQRIGMAEKLGVVADGAPAPITTVDAPPLGSSATTTPNETLLLQIWQDVLGVPTAGVDDHFLALGGDSVLAAHVLLRFHKATGLRLPVRRLFDTPTVRAFARELDAEARERSPVEAATPNGSDVTGPLSFAQERLWFLHQLDPALVAYNVPLALRLRGPMNREALERSVNELVRRHEALRTTLATDGASGGPIQRVEPFRHWPLTVQSVPEEALGERASAEARRPFSLESGPLVRFVVFRMQADDHLLLITMHHVVTDGWSRRVLQRELAQLYAAFTRGTPIALPTPALRYVDYARLERDRLQSGAFARSLDYWTETLADAAPVIELPAAKARPSTPTYAGARQPITLPKAIAARVAELCRAEHVTPFMVLLSTFGALLHRSTAEGKIVVGVPTANRTHDGGESAIGFFANTLPLAIDLRDDPPFRELLARVRESALGAFAHEGVPFDKLVEARRPARDPGRAPIVQVLFAFQNVGATKNEEVPGLDVSFEHVPIDTGTAKFDLTLELEPRNGELAGWFEYSTDLFDASAIARLREHFEVLLDSALSDPTARVSALTILSEEERRTLLVEWNATERRYAEADLLLHELVEQQVARTPAAVAVRFEGTALTYVELDRRANQLAHRLIALGVGPDVLVGVCLERSLEMIVGALGVLKAGGAYVPLDPQYPNDRLAFMLGDIEARVLLTDERLLAALPEHDAVVVCLDPSWRGLAREPDHAPPPLRARPDLAYGIFTSGSTGKPKCALNTHRGIVNRLLWMQETYRLTPADRVLQKTSFAFDVSVWELFWPLFTGAEMVFASPGRQGDVGYLVQVIRDRAVTTLHFVPSMLRAFLEEASAETCRTITRVICSGEVLPLDLQERFFERFDAELHNLYGPTEAAVDVTFWPCARERARSARSVPIGRPVANTQMYVLDGHRRPVPIGVTGEIHIGGVQVARGYRNRPELTAEKFVRDPFSAAEDALLYRTGDLGRFRPDGVLEYVGRVDHQVKIRGFRIELGEIEAVLGELPAVREAVVVARADSSGEPRLVAYWTASASTSSKIDHADLREVIGRKLPESMVPSAFVQLDVLPLMANGKVDRKALPAPARGRTGLGRAFVPPFTPEQEAITEVVASVLGIDRVGIDDNVFDLGLDSIRALKLLARVRESGLAPTLQQIFRLQTPRKLAAELSLDAGMLPERVEIGPFSLVSDEDRSRLPRGIVDAYPLVRLQLGMVFHSDLDVESSVYHDIFSYRVAAPVQREELRSVLDAVVASHPALRTSFDLSGYAQPLQLVHECVSLPLTIEDLSAESSDGQRDAIQSWIEAEKKRRFHWTSAPLFRVMVHVLAEDAFQLTLSFHHAILDGWSVASLLAELLERYQALLADDSDAARRVVSPTTTYRDFVVLEHQAIASTENARYWEERLADVRGSRLPEGFGPNVAKPSAIRHVVPLADDTARGLAELARSHAIPMKSALLGAHFAVLAFVTGEEHVLTGIVTSGRPEAVDGDRVLGLFLNVLPVRHHVRGDTRWIDLARAAFEAELEFLPHRRYPFAEVQSRFRQARLFDTTFNFNHFHVYEELIESGILDFSRNHFEQTNYELAVTFRDVGGRLQLELVGSTGSFDDEGLASLADRYVRALEAMASRPGDAIRTSNLLSPAERHRLVGEWNDTARAFTGERCIHELIEDQVDRTPDAPAVELDGTALTYRQLDDGANRLAHHLVSLGVGPDVLVGVCMDRSLALAVALLAVLKAGGAYVPLEPAYPAKRLAFMLEDSRPHVLLVDRKSAQVMAEAGRLDVVCVDDLAAPPVRSRLCCAATPRNLAYVMYTSGSTGTPKGVPITHGAVVNFLQSMREAPGIESSDRLLAVTTFSFDISGLELYLPLVVGATVVIASRDVAMDGRRLAEKLEADRISFLQATPATWRLLLGAGWNGARRLKALCGGEAMPSDLAELLRERCASVWNMYGPTETTIWSSLHEVTSADATAAVPIGRPIANTQIHVLDASRQPVPVGTPGELYIGGAGLARGYLARPELEAERFVADPFRAAARLYRTGDLGRRRPDGAIEYLGRTDHQVKLRGFRIELGEIEAALREDAGIHEAVVIAREDIPGDMRLVAYFTSAGGTVAHDVDTAELRRELRAKLPEHMVPSAFVQLEALPLTGSGKVDRRALPAPHASPRATVSPAPRTPVEDALARIFAEVLRVDCVGVDDQFFESGGHSLLATAVVARIAKAFGVELPLRSVFEQPTVATLAQLVERERARARGARAQPIDTIAVLDDVPAVLSFAQERFWFLERLERGSAAHNVSAVFDVAGAIDWTVIADCLTEIVRRHEPLRTTFIEDGRTVPIAAEPGPVHVPVVDLSDLPNPDRLGERRRIILEETSRPLALEDGPVFRACVLALAPEEHTIVVVAHHAAVDDWSISILAEELGLLYDAFSRGQPSPLPPLAVRYRDFAAWQRRRVTGVVLRETLDYWRGRLAGAPALLELPTDRPRPSVQSSRGTRRSLVFPAALTTALKDVARRHDATLFMALVAGLSVVLHRYSGQETIVIGTPIANRSAPEIEGLIGCFVNMLALATDVSGDPPFDEVLKRVRETALGAYAHQAVPFEKLVEELKPTRSRAHSPIFQVMLVLHNAPHAASSPSGLVLERCFTESTTSIYDLLWCFAERDGGLHGWLEYNTDLFEASTIERLCDHLETVLRFVAAEPETRLSSVPMLSEGERRQLLFGWNDTAKRIAHRCVHDLVTEQVARSPHAVAVSFEGANLTYAELDERASRLAHRLVALGVGPGVLVGVCIDRSLDSAGAILAVLKAGGAYVPLEPGYPTKRLAFMIEDSRPRVLLADRPSRAALPESSIPIIYVEESDDGSTDTTVPLRSRATPDDLAYVLYTSGSTGTPKGVQITHRSIVNLFESLREAPGLCPSDRLLAITTFSFDISVLEIFLPLVVGARVVIASRDAVRDGRRLAAQIESDDITFLQATPATWRLLLAAGWNGAKGLTALSGGEALPPDLALRLLERCDAVWNAYGPTETTIYSSLYEVTHASIASAGACVSIGHPVANTELYVLDAFQRPVPVGVSGEIYISGLGLTRGYHRRPELDAEKLLPHPFRPQSGERVYRTGDLARRRPDGAIEFLGRMDHQVKVRGVRIELGEIEAALRELSIVDDAVVATRDDGPAGPRLVAYFTSRDVIEDVEALRRPLRATLPDAMVPTAFVRLDALPLTANGKLDRRSLPAPEAEKRNDPRATPRSPLESVLAEIWASVLHVESVGIDDDFFDLGGHSLLALELLAQVRARLGRDVSVAMLFEGATVAHIASLLAEGAPIDIEPQSPLVPLRASGKQRPLFCVHSITGEVFSFVGLAAELDQDQPVLAFRASGTEPGEAPLASVEAMAGRYVEELQRMQPTGPYRLAGHSLGGVIAFEMAQQLYAGGETVEFLGLLDTTFWRLGPSAHGRGATSDAALAFELFDIAPPGTEGAPLSEDEQLARIVAELRTAGGARQDAAFLARLPGPEATRHLRVLLAMYRAELAYRPEYYPGAVTLFRAQDGRVDPWRLHHLCNRLDVCEVPGDHETMLRSPHVTALSRELAARLGESAPRGTARAVPLYSHVEELSPPDQAAASDSRRRR